MCGRGPGVDEGGDDAARADTQRGQDLAEECSAGTLRLPRLLVRTSPLQSERQVVSEREPVQEERATVQDESRRTAEARQQRSVAGSARHAEQFAVRLVELLLPWDASMRGGMTMGRTVLRSGGRPDSYGTDIAQSF